MSCNGIEINLGGKRICIPLYYPVEDRWWEDPDPDPDPWRKAFDDLRGLATIHQRLKRFSDRAIQERLSEAIVGAAKSLKLPEGAKLGDGLFKGQKEMADAEF